jgi:ATP-binding cassette subfamily F protein 3
VHKKVQVLSGGEKSRVAMAKTLLMEANFLLLDEPTNHLDMVSVNILISALQRFEGTYVVISHDRHFISEIANKIWYIEDRKIKEYPGTYEEFVWWQSQQLKEKAVSETKSNPKKVETKTQNNTPKPEKDLKKIKSELQKCEADITETEAKIKLYETDMLKPEIYSSDEKMRKINEQIKKAKSELENLHAKWENLFLSLENA